MNKLSLFLLLLTILPGSQLTAQDQPLTKLDRKWVFFSVRPAVNWEYLKGGGYWIDDVQFDKPRHVGFSAAVDLDNPEMKGFVLRVEYTYRIQHFHFNGTVYPIGFIRNDLKMITKTPELALLYKTPSLWKFRLFVGAGLGWNHRTFVKNEMTMYYGVEPYKTSGFIAIWDGEWSENFCAGILIADRVELNAKYWRTGDISDTQLYELQSKSKIVSLTYRF